MPDIDLSDPNLDPSVQQEFRLREQARAQASRSKEPANTPPKDERMISMISSVGQLDLDEHRELDFHGLSSGTVFFKRMKEHFRTLLGRDYQVPLMPRRSKPGLGVFGVTSPQSTVSSPWDRGGTPGPNNLPSKEMSRTLCDYALNYATCVLRIIHRPSFFDMLDRLYEKRPEDFGVEDNRNMALVFSVMALGCVYNVSDDRGTGAPPYEAATEQGYANAPSKVPKAIELTGS
jgi:hypothetical protein